MSSRTGFKASLSSWANFRATSLLACAVLVAALLTPSAAGAITDASTTAGPSSVQVCGTPAPGQMSCLAVRRTDVSQPAALASSPNVAMPDLAPAGYGPAELKAAYNLDTSLGSGQTVAIVDAYDNPSAEADLAVYRAQYGLPACTTANGCFRKVNQAGTSSPLPAANSGWAAEIALDVDMVSSVCPQCNILLVEANSSYTSDLGAAVDTAVALGAKFVSNSYGGADSSGQAQHFNHPGVAITASTGDNGYGVSFPASAPTVTAVGGTSLVRSATARGWSESAWSGAGSGCSSVFGKPALQSLVATGCANRAVADVAAVADPNTGVAVYSGGWGVYGGTSASAPIIAAVYALAGTPAAADYPNSYPYANSDSLNDVASGSNGSCGGTALCGSRTGWDGPTGLGTPDGAAAFSSTGVVGPPTKLGATVSVSNPVIPGTSTAASVTPVLPPGDAVTSIKWKSARIDCTFSAPALTQTSISCPAIASGTTSVTVTLSDTAGASKVVTVPLVFSTSGAKRALAVSFGVAGQTGSPQSVCLSAGTPLQASVTDAVTGLPVKGVSVAFTASTATGTLLTLARGTSNADGIATSSVLTAQPLTLLANAVAVGPFNAATATPVPITAAKCAPSVTAAIDRSASYYGEPVTVSGVLTRPSAGGEVGLAGASLQLLETVAGRITVLGRAVTAADGSFSAVLRPTVTGTLSVLLAATPSWTAASATAGTITVSLPSTVITAGLNATDVGYAAPVVASGTLTRDAGGVLSPVPSGAVSIRSTSATGVVSVLGSAPVTATGSWKASVLPRTSGTVSAWYTGAPGQPAASTVAGGLTVGTWTPSLSLTAAATQQVAGALNRMTGTVTRAYGSSAGAAPAVTVRLYLQTTTGANVLLGSAVTSASGSFTVNAAPAENGTVVARIVSVPGYTDSASNQIAISVSTKVTGMAPVYIGTGLVFTVTATVTAPRVAAVTLESWNGSSWSAVASAASASTGIARFAVTAGPVGSYSYRLRVLGDSRGADGTSSSLAVTVR